MRKSLFCLFLFVMTLPAFSDNEFTVDTQIEWNGDVVADAIRSVDLDQDTSNKILVDLLLGRDKFSVGDAVGECKKHCNQLSQTSQDFCPTVCGNFATNLVTINNERAGKSVNCLEGTFNIGFKDCISPKLNGNIDFDLTQEQRWTVKFDYDTIKGVSACTPVEGRNYSSSALNPDWDATIVAEWLKPSNMIRQRDSGDNCWCKVITPSAISNYWVYAGYYPDCHAICNNTCAALLAYDFNFRFGIISILGVGEPVK